MKKQLNNLPMAVSHEQAIDTIYAMYKEPRTPLPIKTVGKYGLINPGPKDIPNILNKIERKVATLEDRQKHRSMEEVVGNYIHDKAPADPYADILDQLSDWVRFAIILPNYQTAPMVIAQFLSEFGGRIDIHEKPDYEAIHQHTNYKNVNLEFQFHTQEYAELKKATDLFYHNYNNVILQKNSRVAEQYEREQQQIINYCQMIYRDSDFKQSLPAVQEVADTYYARTKGKIAHNTKLKYFCMYVRKAEMVQNELAEFLPQFLQKINKMEHTILTNEEKVKL